MLRQKHCRSTDDGCLPLRDERGFEKSQAAMELSILGGDSGAGHIGSRATHLWYQEGSQT